MNLQKIKDHFPEYSDMKLGEFFQYMHKTYYSDIKITDMYKALLKLTEIVKKEEVKEVEKVEEPEKKKEEKKENIKEEIKEEKPANYLSGNKNPCIMDINDKLCALMDKIDKLVEVNKKSNK